MENNLTRFLLLLQHNSFTCLLYMHLGTVSSIDGVLMGSIGTYREKTPWSLICRLVSRQSWVRPCPALQGAGL